MNKKQNLPKATLVCVAGIFFAGAVFGATIDSTNADDSISPSPVASGNPRELYNAGTEKLRAGKLNDAESLLEASLAKQDERVQPEALFNLGHVRFDQGIEELKKSPEGAVKRGQTAADAGAGAIAQATDALVSNDVQQMVEAYMAGRGVRKEMTAATKAVRRALDAYGKTLLKWRRALNDFQSAAELNPADTNAARNAEIVEQAIAKLVDSLREMQQLAANLGDKKSELDELMKQLKGKIPAPNMPPGASGGKDDDDEGDDGKKPSPESLSGKEESDKGGGGEEIGLKLTAEQAGQIMNSIQPDGKPLPMGQGETDTPKNRSGRRAKPNRARPDAGEPDDGPVDANHAVAAGGGYFRADHSDGDV
jgi:tetratricopeptide (TPR) repeat protein